jgi:hypothetical protein
MCRRRGETGSEKGGTEDVFDSHGKHPPHIGRKLIVRRTGKLLA